MLRPFAWLAPLIVRLIRANPSIAPRLAFAPPRALHAVAAWLQHAERTGLDEGALCRRLAEVAPRSLLREAMPGAPAKMYRLLDRCSMPVWRLESYLGLRRVLDEHVEDLLPDAGQIRTDAIIDALEVLGMEPLVQNAGRAAGDANGRESLASVLAILRACDAVTRLKLLPRNAGVTGLARAVRVDVGKLEAPPHDFPIPAGWRRVTQVGELWDLGSRMGLCVAPGRLGMGDLTVSMLMNRSVFLTHEAPPALAQIREMPQGFWCIEQVRGARNSLVSDLATSLEASLRDQGLPLIPTTLQRALDRLLDPPPTPRFRALRRLPYIPAV